jgi:hypothetical protein
MLDTAPTASKVVRFNLRMVTPLVELTLRQLTDVVTRLCFFIEWGLTDVVTRLCFFIEWGSVTTTADVRRA